MMKPISAALVVFAALLSSCSDQDTTDGDAALLGEADPAEAGSAEVDTPEQIIARLFDSADLNQSGVLTPAEATPYFDSVLISKDSDDDGSLTLAEFQEWDAGFLAIAEQGGTAAAYNARKEEIFNRWDANGDGQLILEEFHSGILEELDAAPQQQQGRMTPEEFANVAFVRDMAAAAVQ